MTIYIVTAGRDYEGRDVMHVASTHKKAIKYQKALKDWRYGYDTVEIERVTVDEDFRDVFEKGAKK